MLRNLIKDSAVYGGADLVIKALAFFAFPIIAAALSPSEFGLLELIITVTSLLGLIVNCGLNNAVARFYWDKDTQELERPIIVSSGFLAQIVFGILALIIGGLSLSLIVPEIKLMELPVTWIGLVSALILMVLSQWLRFLLDITRLHFAPWYFFILSLMSGVLGLGLGIIAVVLLGWGLDGLLAIQAISAFSTLPLGLWLVRKDLTLTISREWFMELTRFGYPFIFAGIAYWLFASMDRWMLAKMYSIEEVGIYSVAFRFASVVFFISNAFGRAWSPNAIKIRTDFPDTYREFYSQVLLLFLFVMLIVGGGVALFAGELIGVIMPAKYEASALPLAILCFGIVLQSTQQITAVGISIEKKTYLFVRLAWLTAIINFILNWNLIPLYGAQGAAWATLFSYLVLTAGYMYFTQKLHYLPIPWVKLLLIIFLGVCVLILSVTKNAIVISWETISFKIIFSILCMGIAWRVLPLKSLKRD